MAKFSEINTPSSNNRRDKWQNLEQNCFTPRWVYAGLFAAHRRLRHIDIGLGGCCTRNKRGDVHRTNSARLLHRSRTLTLSPTTYRRIGDAKFGVRAPSHFLHRRSSYRKTCQETSTDAQMDSALCSCRLARPVTLRLVLKCAIDGRSVLPAICHGLHGHPCGNLRATNSLDDSLAT